MIDLFEYRYIVIQLYMTIFTCKIVTSRNVLELLQRKMYSNRHLCRCRRDMQIDSNDGTVSDQTRRVPAMASWTPGNPGLLWSGIPYPSLRVR